MSTHQLGWEDLARRQAGLVARRQLLRLGLSWDAVQAQLDARRWQAVSSTVLCTTTGVLTREQLRWAGVLHAGPGSAVGHLSALEVHGLERWHRPEVTVLLAKSHHVEPLPGVRFVQTRRHVAAATSRHSGLPVWRVEPAALLFAAYEPVTRTAYGLLSATVQQHLTTPVELERWIGRMRPLRRAKPFRRLLAEMAGGVQSVAELDVSRMCRTFGLPAPRRQTRRRDSSGRPRYTDAEWLLPVAGS